MNELKIKKNSITVKTKNWDNYFVEATKEEFSKVLNSNIIFIDLWDAIVNKYEIIKVEDTYLNDIETAILSYDKTIRIKLKERERQKIERVWKWFESVQEVYNYVNNNILNK